jgi:UDP-glucose 4-epimerase
MRIVVTGATGNVGTSVLRALAEDTQVDEIVGLARRKPDLTMPKTTFVAADVAEDDLTPHFKGADVVIHLAWLIQPSRDREKTRRVNVEGSRRVFEATVRAGVGSLVYASSVGAYSPGPKDRSVDETWPTEGVQTSFYSSDKADVERILNGFDNVLRVVRLRPGLIFKGEAGAGIRRLFAGPLLPNPLLRKAFIPVVPDIAGLRFQAVHSHDIAQAYRLAALGDVRGAFNVASDPVLDPSELARLLGARTVPMSPRLVRLFTDVTWRARLQPTPPGWLDMALSVPIMDISRAHDVLGWQPSQTAGDALLELIDGMRRGDGVATAPLAPGGAGPARVKEILTGIGGRN